MKASNSFSSEKEHLPASLRLIVGVSGGVIRMIRKQKIRMKAPPANGFTDINGISGSWIELRKADGSINFRRAIYASFNDDVEVFTEKGTEPASWQQSKGMEKIMAIIVPDLPETSHMAIMSRISEKDNNILLERALFSLKD